MADPDELPPLDPTTLDAVEARIDAWFRAQAADHPVVEAVDRGEPGSRRWYVRVRGEEKDVFTLWFTLGQRTLQYETYVMPAPEEDHARFHEHLLVRNRGLYGWHFAIGEEEAVFLVGAVDVAPLVAADHLEATLDRLVGSGWAYVEQCFRPALRIGFASRFR